MRSARWALPLGALLFFWAMLSAPHALAQHGGAGGGSHSGGISGGGAPGPGGAAFGGGAFGPNADNRGGPPPGNPPDSAGTVSTLRGGLQLGPPGRWWDDKHFARDLKLRPDQQRRMDTIFEANRAVLARRLQDTHQEEGRLEALVRSRSTDEAALDSQIDRRSQARAELEKAYTHYLLLIRKEMDAEQLARLEDHH